MYSPIAVSRKAKPWSISSSLMAAHLAASASCMRFRCARISSFEIWVSSPMCAGGCDVGVYVSVCLCCVCVCLKERARVHSDACLSVPRSVCPRAGENACVGALVITVIAGSQ